MANTSHRAGPLKQTNKSHKTGGHRSKGAVDNLNRGRVSSLSSGGIRKAKHNQVSRNTRRNKLKQVRALKLEPILEEKRCASSGVTAPILVAVIPLIPVDGVFVERLATLLNHEPGSDWTFKEHGHVHSPQQFKRRFHFVQPNVEELFAVLDVAKVCDAVVFIVDDNVGLKSERLVRAITDQGLPSQAVFACEKKSANVKGMKKWIDTACPSACDKVFPLENGQQAKNFLRHLGELRKFKHNSLRDCRPHLLSEETTYESINSTHGYLKLTGFIRGGVGVNVNRLVHVPGWGDFQVLSLQKQPDPWTMKERRNKDDVEMSDVVTPDANLQDDLITENEPDMLDGEQTWPTDEELRGAEQNIKKRVVKVPRGTSDYQAAWILDEADDEKGDEDKEVDEDDDVNLEPDVEDDDDASSESDACEMEEEEEEEMSEAVDDVDNYDAKHVNFEEEKEAYSKIKAAKLDEMFPDEVDTPVDVAARVRFQKFRGLKSFRSSPWDCKENLPSDYARIFQFENFRRTRKSVLAANDAEGEEFKVKPGTFVCLILKDVPLHLYSDWAVNQAPLVAFGLLKHENKMSVMNVAVKRTNDPMDSDVIASKERMVFHVGFRRFAASPIFSAHTNGDKHKYERFWRPNQIVVMSMFAPITYPPVNVLVYREMASGRHSLVGTGNLLSMDPDRLAIKRAVLSGHPCKVRAH